MARWEAHVSRKEDALSASSSAMCAMPSSTSSAPATHSCALSCCVLKRLWSNKTRASRSLTADSKRSAARVRTLISYLEKAKEKIESQSTNNQQLERRIRALETALDRRDSVSFVATRRSSVRAATLRSVAPTTGGAPTPTAASIAARANNASAQVNNR
jgi:hypothetical protein